MRRLPLVRLVGDFDLAEEVLHEAFAAAVERWPRDGVPANPRAWLVSTGPVQGDRCPAPPRPLRASLARDRRTARADRRGRPRPEPKEIEDDRLRLIFTCCHPALDRKAQVALDAPRGLRADDGGDRRCVPDRAGDDGPADRTGKGQDPRRRHPVPVPSRDELPERLESVLAVDLPGVQRGVLRHVGRVADPGGSLGRGHPPGAAARASCCPTRRRSGCSR